MGLMTGSGPFGQTPAGEFNFERPDPARVLYLDPCPKRVRAFLGDELIADSTQAFLLHEVGHQPIYYFPPSDVRGELMVGSDSDSWCPKKGRASYYSVRVGDRLEEDLAWYYPEPLEGAPAQLRGLVAFYFRRVDRWLEEDEEIRGHPRDPYHRIDVMESSRLVEVSLDGSPLAETRRARALFETGLPVRWYMPEEDVRAELQVSDTLSYCPYKGQASYHSIAIEGGEDLVWYYPDPLPEAVSIRGLLCFFNERVDVSLDGVPQERPQSPWAHASGSRGSRAEARPRSTAHS